MVQEGFWSLGLLLNSGTSEAQQMGPAQSTGGRQHVPSVADDRHSLPHVVEMWQWSTACQGAMFPLLAASQSLNWHLL